ncbi:hypothetical protein PG997_007457 [Apiospora hydei]|uniref:Uncharacterized protein n=1 Tax=Apiospora hydei TaxID=1337664 RepID=A0ABR1WBU1_9PEZI
MPLPEKNKLHSTQPCLASPSPSWPSSPWSTLLLPPPFPILNGTLPITNGTLSPINGTLPGNSTNATAHVTTHPYIRRSLRSYPVSLPVPK